jgi:hypothetical protein
MYGQALVADFVIQTLAALIGILVGTLAAFAIDRRKEQQKMQRRAQIVLRSLQKELVDNYRVLQKARPAYRKTPFGRSFYVNTTSWETAVSSGDLPDIIGFQLTDVIAEQYASLMRVRYYLDLLTNLWLISSDIDGYEAKRAGFHKGIQKAMDEVINRHNRVITIISRTTKPT